MLNSKMMKSIVKLSRNVYISLLLEVRTRLQQPRSLPQFVIIGVQKGGTTSLYENLIRHPQVIGALRKEVHYFDRHLADMNNDDAYHSLRWYSAHFPTQAELQRHDAITGEATPFYILDPSIARYMAQVMPDVRIIILLRNPVRRAYSHYQMHRRKGLISKGFSDVIEEEISVLRQFSIEHILEKQIRQIGDNILPSFVSRGIYLPQIKAWLQHFSSDQVLTLQSEDYFAQPQAVLQTTTEFLEISSWEFGYSKTPMDKHTYGKLSEETADRLAAFFDPFNQQLYDFLNVDFGW